ncbi:MAG: hypothetical protein IKV97_04385 [Clostridia bacterium]|nr:hypothetical protein [Clostridia bacterium]
MKITVNSDKITHTQHNFWNNIHFHPTDAIEDDWGKRILDEVSRENVAQNVRLYTMMEDIVTEVNGELSFDFTDNDTRLDYLVSRGFKPLLCYAFIPPFLADQPDVTSSVAKGKTRYKGKMIVASKAKDYSVWQEICRRYTLHILDRYGAEEVSSWHLQCYNEPDIGAFFMGDLKGDPAADAMIRLREYKKLYRAFADGIDNACSDMGIGKLTIGGPALAHHLNFLEGFLEYTSKNNIHLDYVCAHNYGTYPQALHSGEKPLDVENNYNKYIAYKEVLDKYYPDGIEFIMDEWGASSAGFADKDTTPEMLFRETEVYAAYFGKMVTRFVERGADISKLLICLSGQHEMTEDFSGFRNFFSLNFIKKPIYNAFAALRKLHGNIIFHGELPQNTTLLATKNNSEEYSLLYTYSSKNFDEELGDLHIQTEISGMKNAKKHVKVYRIDKDHINPYRVYCQKGWTPDLSEEQIRELRAIAQFVPCEEFDAKVSDGKMILETILTDNCLILVEIY